MVDLRHGPSTDSPFSPQRTSWRPMAALSTPAEYPPFEHSRRCSRQNGVQAGIEPALPAGLEITLVGSARPGHRVHTCAPSGACRKAGAATVVSRGHHDRHVSRHRARQGDVRIDGARVWSICTGLAKPTICLRIAGQAGLDVRLAGVGRARRDACAAGVKRSEASEQSLARRRSGFAATARTSSRGLPGKARPLQSCSAWWMGLTQQRHCSKPCATSGPRRKTETRSHGSPDSKRTRFTSITISAGAHQCHDLGG